MSSACRLCLLCIGLASCATGVDSGSDPIEVVDAGSHLDASLHDGSEGDSASTQDEGVPSEAAPSDTGIGGETAVAETGTLADTGSSADASTDTSVTDSGCPGHGITGALVTFDLTSQSGSETSATATSSATGITAGAALSRASGLTAVSGSGSINASGWPTGTSASPTDYFTVTVTPVAGCSVTLASVAIDVKASTTGPSTGDLATSADAFASHTASFAGTATPTVTLSSVGGTGPIEIRVYGYGASGSSGTFRIENTMTLSGSID
ncbi:MAG TPA: hypothetical protein VGL81_19945 [Polyangiaceae bacterium]